MRVAGLVDAATVPCARIGAMRVRTRLAMPASLALRERPIAGSALARPIAAALNGVLDDGSTAVWVIRRLRVAAVVDVGDDRVGALARAFRQHLLRALAGDGVMRFESAAARLAAFLVDLAQGGAFERWYHARYSHLAALPMAQALRLALLAEADRGEAALLHLAATQRLMPMIDRIGTEGARAALTALPPAEPASAGERDRTAVLDIAAAEPAFRRWGDGAQARLAMVVLVARDLSRSVSEATAIVDAVWFEIVARWFSQEAAVGRQRAAEDRLTPPTAKGRAKRHRKVAGPIVQPRLAPATEPLATPHAGVFLLWRSVVELRLRDLLASPRELLELAAALAGPGRDAARADPALHWLTGCWPDSEDSPPRPPRPLSLARHLVADAAPRVPALVKRRCGAFHVLQDRATEDWLTAGTAARIAAVRRSLDLALASEEGDEMRPLAPDIAHFAAASYPAAALWAVMARAAYADLARRLPGLARSNATWLYANLVAGTGQVRLAGDRAEVVLPAMPLDLVLRMTGIDGTTISLGGGRSFRLRLAEGAS